LNEKIKIKNEIQQSYELCCELKLRKQSLVEKKKSKGPRPRLPQACPGMACPMMGHELGQLACSWADLVIGLDFL
jgi:hypothetical protein